MARPPAQTRAIPHLPTFLAGLARSRRGVSAVEYALLLGAILLVAAVGFRLLGKGTHGATAAAEATFHGDVNYTSGNPSAGPGGGGGLGGGSICDGRSCGAPGGGCFVAGTLIATPSGERPIESLRTGDVVFARASADGETEPRPVMTTYVRPAHSLVDVRTVTADGAREAIRSTPDHLYFTREGGWAAAADLAPGNTLIDSTGHEVQVTGVAPVAQEALVYNFEVGGDHTYFVGRTEVWVHNPANCGAGPAANNGPAAPPPVTGPVLGNNPPPWTGPPTSPAAMAGQLSPGPNGSYFWSGQFSNGDSVKQDAKIWANAHGGNTLEGMIEDNNFHAPQWNPNDPSTKDWWRKTSRLYAMKASGNAYFYAGPDRRDNSVWERIELPTLKANPKVNCVYQIDAATSQQSLIYAKPGASC